MLPGQMVVIEAGTSFRIINDDTDGIIVSLDDNIEIPDEDWDEELQTARIDVPVLNKGPVEAYGHILNDYGYDYVGMFMPSIESLRNRMGRFFDERDVVHVTIDTTLILHNTDPNYNDEEEDIPGEYDSYIIFGNRIKPVNNRYGVQGIVYPAYVEGIMNGHGTYVDELDVTVDEFMDDMVRFYDDGYDLAYAHNTFIGTNEDMLAMASNDEFMFRYLMHLAGLNADIYTTLYETKTKANEEGDAMHATMTRVPDYMAWFFSPSGWYHYGYESRYEWITRQEEVVIAHSGVLDEVLRSMLSVYSMSDPHGIYRVEVDEKVEDALRKINQGELRVLHVDPNINLFFVLGGDKDVAKRLASLLGMTDGYHSGPVVSDGAYRIVLARKMDTIHDVLYSMDFSHQMIAYDGSLFYTTPEYNTFTAASATLLVNPYVRWAALDTIEYTIMYPHASLYEDIFLVRRTRPQGAPNDIDTIIDEHVLRYITPTGLSDTDGALEDVDWVPGMYVDRWGTSHGYMKVDEDQFYVKDNYIREVLESSPLL